MRYLTKFHHHLKGKSSKKLVFLHGLMGNGQNWARIAKAFVDDFEIITYDQRGHGRSFQPKSGYSPEDYAEDLRRILDELSWSRIHLVGHSMGGRNALVFASRYPDRVEKLVIEDIGPDAGDGAIQMAESLINSVPVPFANKAAARQFFQNEFLQIHADKPNAKDLSMFFYTNIVEDNSGQAVWRFFKEGILKSVREGRKTERWQDIEQLKMPVLWLRGENSTDLNPGVFQKIATANPKIECHEIKNSGHWIHFDQPEEFTRRVKEFFSK